MQSCHAVIAALALAAVSSFGAGCGGGSPTPAVANLGETSTETSPSGTSGGNGANSAKGASFSACMRSHGVRNFPDPSSGGGISIDPSMGFDPNSVTFKAAEKACQKLLDIKPPSAAEQAKMQEQALKFSACMRAHGVPKFPDPTFSGGKAQLSIDSKSGISPNSPQFQAAQKACRRVLPGANSRGTASGPKTGSVGGTTGP